MYVWQTCGKCGRNFQISAVRRYDVGANECEECKEKWRSQFKADAAEAAAGFAMLVAFLYANREGIKKFFVTTGTFLKTWASRILNSVRALALHVYDNRQSIKDRTKEIASNISASVKEAHKKLAKKDDTAAEHNVSATLTSSAPHTLKSEIDDFAGSAKQGKDFTVAHTPKTQVDSTTLSRAYYELGKEILKNRRFQHEFADLFKRIISTNNEINTLKKSPIDQPPATDLKGRLQSSAANLNAQRKASTLTVKRDSLVRELGKKAFEIHGSSAGSAEKISAIRSVLDEVTELDDKIKHSSPLDSIPFWQRVPVAILLSIGCFPVGLWLVWKNPRLSFRCKAIWIGGFVGLMAVGIVVEQHQAAKVRDEMAAAKLLWDSGDKAGAIAKYRTVVNGHLHVIPESDRSLIMGRVIDFDAESGNDSSVQELLQKADNDHVVPSMTSDKARKQIEKRNSQSLSNPSVSPERPLPTATANQRDTLSEDFYPFVPGSKRESVETLNFIDGSELKFYHEIIHEKDGVIRTLRKEWHLRNDSQSTPAIIEERYRKQNGFIEIGNKNDKSGSFVYEQQFKIGAKVGDTWKSKQGHQYEVRPFSDLELEGKVIRCAVVDRTNAPDAKSSRQKVTTFVYGQGVGIMITIVRSGTPGDMKPLRSELLMNMPATSSLFNDALSSEKSSGSKSATNKTNSSESDKLTADYLLLTPGLKTKFTSKMLFQSLSETTLLEVAKSDRLIEGESTEFFPRSKDTTGKPVSTKQKYTIKIRVNRDFIDCDGRGMGPALRVKVGAKPGDEWEGNDKEKNERFRFVGFQDIDGSGVNGPYKIRRAVIELRQQKGNVRMRTEFQLEKGHGVVRITMFDLIDRKDKCVFHCSQDWSE